MSRPLRILCTTLPGVSHLFPMVPVLRALRRRGHDVMVASAAGFAPRIAATGLRPATMGIDFTVGGEHAFVPALATARARRDASFAYTRTVLVETLASIALKDLRDVVRAWRPDIVVRDPVEFGGFAIAEALGVPHVTGRENRFLSPTAWKAELGDSLARLTGTDTASAGQLYRYLGLAPTLPSLVAATPELPDAREFGRHVEPTIRFIRPESYRGDARRDGACDSRNGVQRSDPQVLVTFGTVFHDQPDLMRLVLTAAASMSARFTVITGPGIDPARYRPAPANVSFTEFAPLDRVLPGCSAVVTVGGLGTVLAAIEHEIPMVVVPVNADQPTNAARCERLGIGTTIPVARATPAAISAAVTRALTDGPARARMSALAAELRALPSADEAAELVENVARTGAPVPGVAERGAR
ncbi:glycosyltransferase [Nocardia puris]|uniref:glycosyltransferase n=1 Tax=Nocardia puris TaxID=208602 RepID=UPI002B4B305F|nr:glycosyltransferase [Nocardia puris]